MNTASSGHPISRPWAGLAAGLLAASLLLVNTAENMSGVRVREFSRPRYWTDLIVALGVYQRDDFAVSRSAGGNGDPVEVYQATVVNTSLQAELEHWIRRRISRLSGGLKGWEFWRMVPFRLRPSLRGRGRPVVSALEDPGRAWLLGVAFRRLGGVAPFLLPWLAPLAALPLLVWCAFELFEAGFPVAGAAFCLLFASSGYAVGTLCMTHSATGFHLLGVLILVCLAAHGALSSRPTKRGLVLRALLAGPAIALCVLCRVGAATLLPGFVLALFLPARRIWGGHPSKVVASTAGLVGLLWLPTLLVRPPERHPAWLEVWTGLGDFDRTKGYVWDAVKCEEILAREGGGGGPPISLNDPVSGGGYELDIFDSPGQFQRLREALLEREARFEGKARDAVLLDVRQDPGWYLGILAKRLFATVTQRKLWPWGPRDGRSMVRASSPSEGVIDHYYGYTPNADMFRLGSRLYEVPVSVLLGPAVLLVTLALAGAAVAPAATRRGRAGCLALLAVSVGVLPLPVLITTAGAQETEAFVLVHLLALGLLLETGAQALLERRTLRLGRPTPPADVDS